MIRNKTKNTILVNETERADSVFSKAKGLMFRSELGKGRGMLFTFGREDYVGIWMLFVRFPIDLIYLDSKKRVVGIFERIRPVTFNPKTWKVYYPVVPSKYIIEVNSGIIRETGTEIGDSLEFE
jgi:uncharacterized membrane protein (UPF0127 family)